MEFIIKEVKTAKKDKHRRILINQFDLLRELVDENQSLQTMSYNNIMGCCVMRVQWQILIMNLK